jgi:hypothetical protein
MYPTLIKNCIQYIAILPHYPSYCLETTKITKTTKTTKTTVSTQPIPLQGPSFKKIN